MSGADRPSAIAVSTVLKADHIRHQLSAAAARLTVIL
jgi:hypothetical protein